MGDGQTVDSAASFSPCGAWRFPVTTMIQSDPVRESSKVFAASENNLCTRALFADIGLFDEEFFAYFEDVDLSFHARLGRPPCPLLR